MSRKKMFFKLKNKYNKKKLLIIKKSYFKQITAHYEIEGNLVSLK